MEGNYGQVVGLVGWENLLDGIEWCIEKNRDSRYTRNHVDRLKRVVEAIEGMLREQGKPQCDHDNALLDKYGNVVAKGIRVVIRGRTHSVFFGPIVQKIPFGWGGYVELPGQYSLRNSSMSLRLGDRVFPVSPKCSIDDWHMFATHSECVTRVMFYGIGDMPTEEDMRHCGLSSQGSPAKD